MAVVGERHEFSFDLDGFQLLFVDFCLMELTGLCFDIACFSVGTLLLLELWDLGKCAECVFDVGEPW